MKKVINKDKAKTGRPLKDFVPSQFIHIRELTPINPPNQSDKDYQPDNPPRKIPQEFNDSSMKELISETESKELLFTDAHYDQIMLPYSLYHDYLNGEVKWSRPEVYIKENLLDNEIMLRFPNRNKFKFRAKIREMYDEEKKAASIDQPQQEKDDDDYYNDEPRDKYSLYRGFFALINSKPEIRVVNYYTREETNEEYEIRIKNEEEELQRQIKKDPKMKAAAAAAQKKKKTDEAMQQIDKKIIKNVSPSNISMKDGYPLYCRWIASIFQVIKDRNIVDVNTNETIWQKIYPQEDGVPIYNPKGLYVIKLYHMGKIRMIEIDDTMPCSRYEEFYFPRCESLNEIWPALLTKAIIKLYSYKISSSSFQEAGDYSPFYALTGYVPMILQINHSAKLSIEHINVIKEAVNDINYLNKNCYLLCYRKEKEADKDRDKEEAKNPLINETHTMKKEVQFSSNKLASVHQMKKMGTVVMRSSQSLNQLKQLWQEKKLPPQLSSFVENIENNAPVQRILQRKKSIPTNNLHGSKFLLPSKTIRGDRGDDPSPINSRNIVASSSKLIQSSLKQGMEKYDNKIYIGVLYDVIEYFDNREFNMNRLKPIDFSDLKEKVKQLNTNHVFKQLSREDKKQYLENLKNIKQGLKAEKMKRIEDLKLKGFNFKSIKIANSSVEEPKLYVTFTDDEIEMTKRCLDNNWDYPPIEFLDQIYEDKMKFDKSPVSKAHSPEPSNKGNDKKPKLEMSPIVNKKEKEKEKEKAQLTIEKSQDVSLTKTTWSRDVYFQLINNNLEQYQKPTKTIIREKGTWVNPEDFFTCFNSFILLGSPKMLHNVLDWDNNWYNTSDVLSIDESKRIIRLSPDDTNTSMLPYAIMMFCANSDSSNKSKDIPFKINFSLMTKDKTPMTPMVLHHNNDFDEDLDPETKPQKITLKSFVDTKQLKLDVTKEHFLQFEGGIFPCGFYLRLMADFKLENMTYMNYLLQYNNYQRNTFKIEQPIIEKNHPYLLFRLSIVPNDNVKMMIATSQKDYYSLDFTECYLINTKTNHRKQVTFGNIFSIEEEKEGEKDSQGNNEYLLTIVINPPCNIAETTYDIDVLINDSKAATLAQIEGISSYDVYDYYIPNKHQILFQEFVFAAEKVYSMLNVKIVRLIKEETDNIATGTAAGKKDNKLQAVSRIKEMPLVDKVRMRVLLYGRDNELLLSNDFYNETTIHNIIFEGNLINETKAGKTAPSKGAAIPKDDQPPSNIPYKLICIMDKSEMPKWLNVSDNLNGLGWMIRVFSSETLAFCKDTTKEDKERALILSWENTEPGRSERAQISRKKFLIQKKKLAGNQLTEEDEAVLALPRQRKITSQTQPNQAADASPGRKGRKEGKKGSVKQNKLDHEQQAQLSKKDNDIDMNKKEPDMTQHASLFVKNFLFYTHNDRMIQYDHNYPQEAKILNNTKVTQEKTETITSVYEEATKVTRTEGDENIFKTQLVDKNKRIYQRVLNAREEEERPIKEMMKKREEIMMGLAAVKEKEKKLQEIIMINQETIDEKDTKNKFDINVYVQMYNEIIASGYQSELTVKAHEALSKKKEEIILGQMKKLAPGKDKDFKPTAIKHLEDINLNKWIINEEVKAKLESYNIK